MTNNWSVCVQLALLTEMQDCNDVSVFYTCTFCLSLCVSLLLKVSEVMN